MSDVNITLFVDTNAFIQLKDLKDLRWEKIFPKAKSIDIMVAPIVIDELDKHKTSTNQRRRDRARLALKIIDQASQQSDFALVLREERIRVRLVISNAPAYQWEDSNQLDPSRADDQLVAEALSFGNGAAILSHDTGPRIRARLAKLDAHNPLEEWLLPPEQTDDQKKIKKLERDLEYVLENKPKIFSQIANFDENNNCVVLIQPIVQPLSDDQVAELSDTYLKNNPIKKIKSTNNYLHSPFTGVTADDVNRYERKYAAFKTKTIDYYKNLHQLIKRQGKATALEYLIRNESGVAADGLRIEFDLEGPAFIAAKREDISIHIGSSTPPSPPKPPEAHLGIVSLNLPHFKQFEDMVRDPVGFYWFIRPELGSTHSALQCQEFRAKREFKGRIFIFPLEEPNPIIKLRMSLSASNIPNPITIETRIEIATEEVDWSSQSVLNILEDIESD